MTTQAFLKQGKELYSTLPEPLRKAVDLAEKATKKGTDFESFKESAAVTRTINLGIEKLTEFLAANKKAPTKKVSAKKSTTKQPITRHAKPTKNSTKHIAQNKVEELPIEIQIIKRFISYTKKSKTAPQIMNLLDFVQKAIVTKKVRKTSEFADEINYIQSTLIDVYDNMSKTGVVQIEFKNKQQADKYLNIVTNYEPLKSVALIKQYINLDGAKQTKEKAKALWERMHRFVNLESNKNDKHIDAVKFLMPHLSNYFTGETSSLQINSVALSGFFPTLARYGLKAAKYTATGIKAAAKYAKPYANKVVQKTKEAYHKADEKLTRYEKQQKNKGLGSVESGVMSVDAAKAMSFNKIGLTGKLKELIGDACEPTSIFIYGRGGSGKSGLSLQLADALNKKNKSILYVAGEQFSTPTFTELLIKTGIQGGPNFQIVKDLNTLPLSDFDVIVIDSKDSIGLKSSAEFKELRDAFPTKIWIITSQGTKAGDFTGDEKWRNEVDTLIYCENGTASTLEDKNRWGAKASIKIY